MTELQTDPKYVPPLAALQTVGLNIGQLKTNKAIISLIVESQNNIDVTENQISVLVTTLVLRGFTMEDIAVKCSYSLRTITRKYIEGTAMLRTQEVTRTASAIRSCRMSQKVMETATRGGTPDDKINALELAAMDRALSTGYVYEDGGEVTEEDSARILLATREGVTGNAQVMTSHNFIAHIPLISEDFGIIKKVPTPTDPDPDGGANSPMQVDYHIKRALKDARAIAEAAELPYTATPQDVYQILQLCEYLNLVLLLEADVQEAVDALSL